MRLRLCADSSRAAAVDRMTARYRRIGGFTARPHDSALCLEDDVRATRVSNSLQRSAVAVRSGWEHLLMCSWRSPLATIRFLSALRSRRARSTVGSEIHDFAWSPLRLEYAPISWRVLK